MPSACEKPPPALCFMKENLLGRAAKRSQPPAGCFRRESWRMRGQAAPREWGERGGTGMGSAQPAPDCRGRAEQEVTAGLGWLCRCPLQGRSFAVGMGMLRWRHIPWERMWEDGAVSWVLGAIPVLVGIPPLSPSFSSPSPFSLLPLFFPHSPSQQLSWTTHPHALETFQTQQLFQRHPRGPGGSSPPNQTQICNLYANMMCVDAEALLAHTARKQKHMAEAGRAESFGEGFSADLGRIFSSSTQRG